MSTVARFTRNIMSRIPKIIMSMHRTRQPITILPLQRQPQARQNSFLFMI